MRIRGAVLEETRGTLAVQELVLAAPGPHEVLVRLRASGVCHSDLDAIDGTAETPCPAVLGHEGAGVVEVVGEMVTRVRPGGRVALSWLPWCGVCPECERGFSWLCSTAWPELYREGRLPLDRLISHRLALDEVDRAFELMTSGEALRVVLDLGADGA